MVSGVELILSLVKETLLQSELQRRVTEASEWGGGPPASSLVLALWCWEAFRSNLQPLACVWLNVKRLLMRQNNSIHGKEAAMNLSSALKCLLNDAALEQRTWNH